MYLVGSNRSAGTKPFWEHGPTLFSALIPVLAKYIGYGTENLCFPGKNVKFQACVGTLNFSQEKSHSP